MNKVYALEKDEFRSLVLLSKGHSDCLKRIGLDPSGGTSVKLLKKRISELDIKTDHFVGQWAQGKKIPLDEILVENSSYTNIASLKRRLVSEERLLYKCVCGLCDSWNGFKLVLQLDHINGASDDHRIENLRFLCPNCHSQTDTFCGKNKKKAGLVAELVDAQH